MTDLFNHDGPRGGTGRLHQYKGESMTATMEMLFEKKKLILEKIRDVEERQGPGTDEATELLKEHQEIVQSMTKMNKVMNESASKLLKG